MKLSVKDLELALAWIKANSADVAAYVKLEPGRFELRVGTPDNDVATLQLFDADSNLKARINSSNYLEHSIAQSRHKGSK